jgi:hypothetical protein
MQQSKLLHSSDGIRSRDDPVHFVAAVVAVSEHD